MSDIDKKPKALRRAQDLTTTDRARMIRDLEFGSALGAETVAQLAESSRVIDVRRRRFVYRAGEEADALYAIASGRIKLCRIEPHTDREAVIDILPQGALFGESALYSTAAHGKTVLSLTRAACCLEFLPINSNWRWRASPRFMNILSV